MRYLILILTLVLISGCAREVSFNELISNPEDYNGKNVCFEGIYVSGFEANSIGASTYEKDGFIYLTEPSIWVEEQDVIKSEENCFSNEEIPFQFCDVRACGEFIYGEGFGHVGGYEHVIR